MSTCPFCGKTAHQKRNGTVAGKQRYKCLYCVRNYTEGVLPRALPPKQPRMLNKCVQCGRETPNPKFCSRSCNTTYGNLQAPRRKKQPRFCKYCGDSTLSRHNVCRKCSQKYIDWSQRTIGEVQAKSEYQISAVLRNMARRVYKNSGRASICHNCGYDTHIEICHIKAINSFSTDTPVSVVNGIDNLVALCPNCHWEFDNGLLKLTE